MNPYRILLLGSTGMLGSEVAKTLADDELFKITATHRDPRKARSIYKERPSNVEFIDFDCIKDRMSKICSRPAKEYDYIINCIGSTFRMKEKGRIYINSLFPDKLSSWARNHPAYGSCKVIHISTDGVFSGDTGSYTENDKHDARDSYGKSKSIGEPKKDMVIRTSIIGEDKFSNKSLFSWVKSSKGKTIEGYTNHFWNGITAKQYGRLCKKIILNDLHTEGAFHVFSPEKITKFDLINLINKEFDFKIGVLPKEDDKKIDRSLSTIEGLNKILGIPPIQKQLMDLHSGK